MATKAGFRIAGFRLLRKHALVRNDGVGGGVEGAGGGMIKKSILSFLIVVLLGPLVGCAVMIFPILSHELRTGKIDFALVAFVFAIPAGAIQAMTAAVTMVGYANLKGKLPFWVSLLSGAIAFFVNRVTLSMLSATQNPPMHRGSEYVDVVAFYACLTAAGVCWLAIQYYWNETDDDPHHP